MLLARLGLRASKEFRSYVSGKGYTYFSSLSEEARQREYAELAYHNHRALTIIMLGNVGRGKTFLSDRLRQEKKMLKGQAYALTVEQVYSIACVYNDFQMILVKFD